MACCRRPRSKPLVDAWIWDLNFFFKTGILGFDFGGKKRVFDVGVEDLEREREGFRERVVGVERGVAISDCSRTVWLGKKGKSN